MEDEKQKLLHRIEEEWEQMSYGEACSLLAELYEERDIKELLFAKFFDDAEKGSEEEIGFLLATIEDMRAKAK